MGTPAIGSQAKMCMDSVLPIDTSSIPFEFKSENLRKIQTHVETGGIRGTRSRSKERVRISREAISGTIVMNPSPTELDWILEYICGTAQATDVFALGETVSPFQICIDRITKVFTYNDCRISRATFRASSGGLLELSLDIEGETETIGNSGTFPNLTFDTDTAYVMSDGALVLAADASAVQFSSFECVIDNMLDTERYMNSVSRAEIPATDRLITLKLGMAYTVDEVDLYNQAVTGGTGSVTFTNGNQSILFSFANLKAPAESPVVGSKGEILLPLNLVAYKSGTTKELIITNDPTT